MQIKLNERLVDVSVDDLDMPLLWYLREVEGLTGTRYGCGVGQCGSCTVHVDGQATSSCVLPLKSVNGKAITTIEHIHSIEAEAVKRAWCKVNVPQCGYCQSGQIMTAVALLQNKPHPTSNEIEQAMERNLCRCGTYQRIKSAIEIAVKVIGD